jgi:hypothetical protein
MFHYRSFGVVLSWVGSCSQNLLAICGNILKPPCRWPTQCNFLQFCSNNLKFAVPDVLSRGVRSGARLDREPNDKLDLDRLRARLREKPRTKAGQVRQAWPEIKALFEAGHSLKDIWIWLNEIGIEIGYARLSHYTGQLKGRDRAMAERGRGQAESTPDSTVAVKSPEELTVGLEQLVQEPGVDPLANVRERERRQTGFQYNAEPDPKKLI